MTSTFRPDLVPTWAKIAAWAVPLATIPSITWRMVSLIGGLVSGDLCFGPSGPLWEKIYLLAALPSVQLGLALLTVGLIRPWGEVFPRWLPALGGRRVMNFARSSAAHRDHHGLAVVALDLAVIAARQAVLGDAYATLGRISSWR